MSAGERVAPTRLGEVKRSAAQTRIVIAALALFGEHGVSGTSLQMIADRLGVTKAAIYHQYRTKEAIIIAVAETDLANLETALDAAEAEPDRQQALEVLLEQVIDTAVARRHLVRALQSDPVIVRLLAEHRPFMQLMQRLWAMLVGEGTALDARVPAAMISAAIGGAVNHPLVIDLDDETLRLQLMHNTRLFLRLRD